ncbi:MAG TPA: GDSL-type esterase/lipase family protein [Saprospiraceae bacterium]|nr:GDSL-type esterase/lipase family protein [Saprospiraceae bacterium]
MKSFSPGDPRIIWHGRTFEDPPGTKFLIGSVSSFQFRILGNKCRVIIQNGASPGEYNYMSFDIDGVHHERVAIKFDKPTPFELPISSDAEYHDIEIFKETEAPCGQIVITGIESYDLSEVPDQKKMKIEFIGNSITAGMASDPSLVECENGKWYDQHNAYDAYGPRIARTLNLDFSIAAISGIGIYRNWNTDYPVMEDVYQKTFLSVDTNDPEWDFKKFSPDLVCINLGTNDLSAGDGYASRLPFDSTRFINKYVEFIRKIHFQNPQAKFLLLQHSMPGEHHMPMLKVCLESVRHKAESSIDGLRGIEIFSFTSFTPTGCTGHPGLKDHEKMAVELEPVIRGILNL